MCRVSAAVADEPARRSKKCQKVDYHLRGGHVAKGTHRPQLRTGPSLRTPAFQSDPPCTHGESPECPSPRPPPPPSPPRSVPVAFSASARSGWGARAASVHGMHAICTEDARPAQAGPRPIRRTDKLNVRVPDGIKQPWLCGACEGHFGQYETAVATRVFHRMRRFQPIDLMCS